MFVVASTLSSQMGRLLLRRGQVTQQLVTKGCPLGTIRVPALSSRVPIAVEYCNADVHVMGADLQ